MTDEIGTGYSLENAHQFGWASMSGKPAPERAAILKQYLIGPRVLDAGCGGGGYTDFVAGLGYDATGVDKFDMFLSNATDKSFKGSFVNADMCQQLPFADGTFDTAFCLDVLEHVDDEAAIRELARVTRRRLILAVPHEDSRDRKYCLTYFCYVDQTHRRYYNPDSLRSLIGITNPRRVEIFLQDRVPLEYMVRQEFQIKSRYPGLAQIYRPLFQFLLTRAVGPDWHIGLTAVVDLPGIGDPPRGSGS